MDLTMMERVGERWGKNGRILFDRPKPTVGCSAGGRRRRIKHYTPVYRIFTYSSDDGIVCEAKQLLAAVDCTS
jgi:hypothetical protein